MNPFQSGFIKFATAECGLSEEDAAVAFKRAMEYPPAEELFKQMPAAVSPPASNGDSTAGDMQNADYEALQAFLAQDKEYRAMRAMRQQLAAVH